MLQSSPRKPPISSTWDFGTGTGTGTGTFQSTGTVRSMKPAMPESDSESASPQLTRVLTDNKQDLQLPSSSLSPLRIPNGNGNINEYILDERVDGLKMVQDVS